MTYILMAILVLMFVGAMTPGLGKFWHDHDWQLAQMKVVPSVYWSNKETVYHVYKCANCSAFRTDTEMVEKSA